MVLPTQEQVRYTQDLLASRHNVDTGSVVETIKSNLNLQEHPEGGYFVETDRDMLQIPNPFHGTAIYPNATVKDNNNVNNVDETSFRNASTTIHYYLDPVRPNGVFHRNKGRTVHTLHWGRGIYVLIHIDESEPTTPFSQTPLPSHAGKPLKIRVETFTVGPNIAAGERLQWIVDGGKFKASFLLPDEGTSKSEKGLLISETVVPGFEYMDHDFLTIDGLRTLVSEEEFDALKWLLHEDQSVVRA